jgi:ribokinase
VVVLGSINMDLVVQVPALPRPGDTVLGDRLLLIPGGKGANQATAAARLGARVQMIGRVGADAFGAQLLEGLREDGVDASGVTVDLSEPSGAALIVVETGGQNQITVAPGANGRVGPDEVRRLRDVLDRGDVLILQLEVPLATVRTAVEVGNDAGARVILNAAPSTALVEDEVPPVELLVVNEAEAAELGLARLRAPAAVLVVTLGAAGSVIHEGDRVTRIDPHRVDAVDATAAGDAFVGALAFAVADRWPVIDAVRLAGAAGAAAVTKLGARSSLPRPADLERLFGIKLTSSPRAAGGGAGGGPR